MRIIYNGVDLQVLDLTEAVCQPIYDDSNTDLLYCMYRISANVMVNGLANVIQDPAGPAISLSKDTATSTTLWKEQDQYTPPRLVIPDTTAPNSKNTAFLGKTPLGSNGDSTAPNAIPFSNVIESNNRKTFVVAPAAGPSSVTMQILNSKLNEPRAQLWVFEGNGGVDEVIVRSHQNDQVCDCKNGPFPIATSIMRAFGDGATYFLNFQVQTFVDMRIRGASEELPNVLISNRFSTTHHVNADGLLAIAVEGVAHGRTDLMYDSGNSLDALRKSLFLPVPGGFTRENIQVTGSADGSSVKYSYVDVQAAVNFVAGRYVHATQIEAVHRQSVEMGGMKYGETAIDVYEKYNSLRLNTLWRQEAAERASGAAAREKTEASIMRSKASYWKSKAKAARSGTKIPKAEKKEGEE